MPSTRTRRSRSNTSLVLDDAVRLHLEIGDCLLPGRGLGCGCGLIDANGLLREDEQRRLLALLEKKIEHS